MKALPQDAVPYRKTAEFTESTVPAALLSRHSTRPDVWARICVLEGSLLYRILEPVVKEHRLSPENPGIVEPAVPHEVQPLGRVRFFVEFLRRETTDFSTLALADAPSVVAPDGADVRVLLALRGGSMARFELPASGVSRAVAHRTVEEIWLVLSGRGEMWRKQSVREEITALEPGVCLTIPLGVHFQFRAAETLTAVAVTVPPWPGSDEAYEVEGPWQPRSGWRSLPG
jgi:mannose-6-phosphate isomerase-like protein (cupin superfamily)